MCVTRLAAQPLGRGEAGWPDLGKSCSLWVHGLARGQLTDFRGDRLSPFECLEVLGRFLPNHIPVGPAGWAAAGQPGLPRARRPGEST